MYGHSWLTSRTKIPPFPVSVPVPSMPFPSLSLNRPTSLFWVMVGPARYLLLVSHQQFSWHQFLVSHWRYGHHKLLVSWWQPDWHPLLVLCQRPGRRPLLVLASSSSTTTGIPPVPLTCRGVMSLLLASCQVNQRAPVYWGINPTFLPLSHTLHLLPPYFLPVILLMLHFCPALLSSADWLLAPELHCCSLAFNLTHLCRRVCTFD